MDYTQIRTAAYAYADRTDLETVNMYDFFLGIVEARINRVLKTLKMSSRTSILTSLVSEYYGLPDGFLGMRDLRIQNPNAQDSSKTVTVLYRTPAQINELKNKESESTGVYYSIIGDQLHIQPPQDNKVMEMLYYKNVPPLNATDDENWLSIDNPDCYIFGVLTEISAFNKDKESAMLWGDRFTQSLEEIVNNDTDIRWDSGDALQIRTL